VVRPVHRRSRRDEACDPRPRIGVGGRFRDDSVQVRELLPAAAVMLDRLVLRRAPQRRARGPAHRCSTVPWPPSSGSRCSPSPATSSAEIYVWNALVCLGVGLVLAATPVLTMGDVPPERTAESTVANSTIRYVGSALGAQVAASIVAGQPGSHGYTAVAGRPDRAVTASAGQVDE